MPARGRHPLPRIERLERVVQAQRGRCFWCGRDFGPLVRPTVDHVVPRVKGGPSWPENEVAACRRCNAERGHRTPVDWLEECLRRGWPVTAADLSAVLEALDAAVETHGGARRARPYLRGQLRRLTRWGSGTR